MEQCRGAAAMLLLVACLTGTPRLADSHGMLINPISRNYQSFQSDFFEIRAWNPTECNGGGVKVVSDHGKLKWPQGKFDLCGDPWNREKKYFNYMRKVGATYKAGQVIEVHQLISANHAGRMIIRLCPNDATAANYKGKCKVLPRADCKGSHCVHWTLPPGQGSDPKGRPLLPAYTDKTFNWYIYSSKDDFDKIPVYIVKYKLPDGFKCDHCILHWYWLTGNTCNPPCDMSDPLYPNCNRLQMGYCGESDRPEKYPEEFWSCADIKIA